MPPSTWVNPNVVEVLAGTNGRTKGPPLLSRAAVLISFEPFEHAAYSPSVDHSSRVEILRIHVMNSSSSIE